MKNALANLTVAQILVVHEAMAALVENEECRYDADGPDADRLTHARAVLAKLDAAVAALAEVES